MSVNSQNAICTSVAVFLVLMTLYFTTNALKRGYEINQLKLEMENRQRELEREQLKLFKQQMAEREIQRQADILDKLKEHQYYCYDLQIFTLQTDAEEPLKHFKTTDQLNQTTLKQYKKTYRKKDLNKPQPTKKSSSSEPIIYLFVLVFLYLLLKAASDITQHYKEQSRGDKKNNRRCSLQVYAQMKNDRRSSKENRLLTMNARSKSVDRPILQRSKRIYPKLRSYTSVDERPSCSFSSTVLPEISAENNIPTNLVVPSFRPKSLLLSDISLSRRSSVPALSLQQMGILSRRRTSLVDADPLGLETKKRHRMIQRH